MSVEILKALDSVEAKMGDFKTEQAILADRMMQIEQKATALPGEFSTKGDSLGALVAKKFAEGLESFRAHKVLAMQIETKSITGSLVGARSSIAPTPGPDVQVDTQLVPKLAFRPSGGIASLVYPRRAVAIVGGATAVSENGLRTQSQPIYTSITQNLTTIAGYAELSETALRTTGELQSVIDLHLMADVFRATDGLLVAGGTEFAGGLLALATPDVLPVISSNDLLEETVAIGAMTMRAAGYRPDICIVNPTDWRGVYLRRDVDNGYIHSSPLLQAPLTISGLAVVFSSAVTTKQALLLDSRYCDFMPAASIRIELAHVASQFLTGEITVRAELQGLPVVRDLAAIKLMSRA